jgi:MFS transporter, DHA2 family, methylenomycin A resistance protein
MATVQMNGAMRDPRFVLLATSLGVLLAQIDTSVVNLGLKSIARDLNAGVGEMQWVIDAYNVVYATLLLTGGTLGDIYGRRRLFLVGISLFAVGTTICALAPNAAVLIAGRAISGRGAAFALPMSLVLLTQPTRAGRSALTRWASGRAATGLLSSSARAWAAGLWTASAGGAFSI